ncbi:MAG: hypothetical protein LRY72_16660 [Saccharospirillaceae bacterium]|nr:hypothetical protein [Saccharospirillaceae bacterium]
MVRIRYHRLWGGALALSAADVMVVPGLAAQPDGGLDVPASEYTVAFRISIEEAANNLWRGILQKGDGAMDRQPGIFLHPDAESLHATNSTNQSDNRIVDVADIPFRQWLNVVYSKRADGLDIYLDGELAASYPFAPGEASLANNGNLYVGNIPGAAESFTGLIDDIQVYNRVLNAGERLQILPAPPLGEVQFVQAGAQLDENAGSVTVLLERTRGSKAPLTVYVDMNAATSTATLGDQTDMADPLHPADLAFGAAYVSGTGVPVTWPADTRGQQSLTITLDYADDNLREGTEIARLRLANTGGAASGLNSTFTLRLNDVTPNPFGNFSVTGPDPMVVLENNPATQSLCVVRESGAQGEVTVNYNISGTAVAGTDFNYLPSGIEPVAASGSVTFADGDSTDKCFDIAVVNNPAIGTPDIHLQVTITGLNHDAGLDPLLTAQNQAQLVIRDYSPGEFGFSASSYTCKEPNTSSLVPESLRPSASELVCEVAVIRNNTGIYAPAATLNVVAPVDVANYGYNASLSWPAITPASPATAGSEVQLITFVIANDDIQEIDQLIPVSLSATNGDGHNEVITAGNMTLTIVDVTTPAIISLSSESSTINEGSNAVFNIQRSGNANTVFNFEYEVNVEGKTAGKSNSDYVDFGAGSAETGVISYSSGGSPNRQLVFKTIDTLEPLASVGLRLTLKNPSTPRTVGMGVLSNANLDNAINQTDSLVTVLNTKDLIQNNYSITLTDGGDVRQYQTGSDAAMPTYLVALEQHSPNRRVINWSFTIPAKNTLDIDHTKIRYTWRLLNAAGTAYATWFDGVTTQSDSSDTLGGVTGLFANGSGVADYGVGAQQPSDGLTVTGTARVPFVLDPTQFRLELTLEGGDGVSYPELFRRTVMFTAQPYYRQLYNNGKCLNRSGKTSSCGYPANFWTWNPSYSRLINRQSWLDSATNICFQQSGSGVSMVNCSNTSNTSVTFPTVSGFNQLNVGNNAVCGTLWSDNLSQTGSPGGCIEAHRTWSWSAPLEF